MPDIVRVAPEADEDRFARFRLIGWWEQERLASARVVVVGAGALGNEILKNLALLGVGNVFLADLDVVAHSNLSRSVLFRAEDCGRPKVEVAARRACDIYPGLKVRPFHGNVVYDLGLGVYRWADVILGGLDNREARVAINQSAARAGKVWIDGAIERLDGVARVFDPATGPCYECTMSEVDWKMLEARRSCALLTRAQMEEGKVPTTPTTASVVAGIQCQEAVKFLHGLEVLSGKGYVFEGRYHQSYLVHYTRSEDCPAHEVYEPVEVLPWCVADTPVGQLLDRARADLGPDAVLETNQDLLSSLTCVRCGVEEERLASLGKVTEEQGRCPRCGEMRTPNVFHTISEDNRLRDRTFGALGVPAWDVVGARVGLRQRFYEFGGDRTTVLGPLANRGRRASMSQTAPDVQQLAQQSLTETAFPGGRNQSFRVFIKPEAHGELWKHANEHSGLEICGVLVGKWAKDADGPFLLVSDGIRGEAATSKFAEVTFTHDTWAKINHEMDTRFTDLSIVGWYHSHPDFGIFLSDRDRFIQEHFFAGPGQIALVVDPVRKTEGVFVWKQGKPALAPHYWVGDRVQASTAAGEEANGKAALSSPAVAGGQSAAPPADELPWLSAVTNVLLCVLLFLGGYVLASWLHSGASARDQFRIRQDALAWALVHLNFRPGFDKDLDAAGEELDDAARAARGLAGKHLKLLDKPDEARKEWEDVFRKLDKATDRLKTMRVMYSLTPDEVDALLKTLRAKELPEPATRGKGPKEKKKDEKK